MFKFVGKVVTAPYNAVKKSISSNIDHAKDNVSYTKKLIEANTKGLSDKEAQKRIKEDTVRYQKMSFEQILNEWELEKEDIPKIIKMLKFEIGFYCFLILVGIINIYYTAFSNVSVYSVFGSLIIILIAAIAILARYYRYVVLKKQRYMPFKYFLLTFFRKEDS